MSANYYRRPWDESRGDEYDSWGTSVYSFETDLSGVVLRQLQIYEDGHILKYEESHAEDGYGMIAAHPLPLDEFEAFRITKTDFEEAWAKAVRTK